MQGPAPGSPGRFKGNTGSFPSALNSAILPPKNETRENACLDRLLMVYYRGSRLKPARRASTIETILIFLTGDSPSFRLKPARRASTIETLWERLNIISPHNRAKARTSCKHD